MVSANSQKLPPPYFVLVYLGLQMTCIYSTTLELFVNKISLLIFLSILSFYVVRLKKLKKFKMKLDACTQVYITNYVKIVKAV